MDQKNALLPLVQRYFERDPVSAAHSLETMDPADAVNVLKSIPSAMAADAVATLDHTTASSLLQQLPGQLFVGIVEKLEPQQALAVFLNLPEDVRQKFIERLGEKKKKQITDLLAYPVDSVGRLMTTQVVTFHSDVKVRDAIRKIKLMSQKGGAASYVYVVDTENRLVGVLNMRDMLVADENQLLEQVMRKDLFTLNAFADREKAANELSTRRYFAAPVVDNENKLLGVVKAERLIEEVKDEATEDIQRMFGVGGDERAFSPIGYSLKKRLPWLHINLATAFLAAAVVSLFEDIIAKITILAVFLPVVAGQGGNAGGQSLAVVMRGLVMREIPNHRAKDLIFKETLIGLANGIIIGIVTAAVAWLWKGNPYLGLVIGLGMVVNLSVAGLSGAAIPIMMKGLGLDPAQCSNIILTTVTDVMGFFAFLGFAVLFQGYLV